MSLDGPPFAVFPGGDPAHADDSNESEFQELWLSLATRPWASLVLVPADRGASTARVATALAAVGTRLRETPVTAIVAHALDYASVRALTDIQPQLHGKDWTEAIEITRAPIGTRDLATEPAPSRIIREAKPIPPMGRAVIAIQPVVEEPLGVAVAQAADAVLLCVEMGRSHIRAVHRTVELIGRDKIVGALLLQ